MYRPAFVTYKPHFTRPELLLHPNIPKPLHGVNPRTILGKEWWDVQRQDAYKKNNYCCWACGVSKDVAEYFAWLEAHEYYDINYEVGEVKLVEIVALCHSCHNFIHDGRMTELVNSGEMSIEKQNSILDHGYKILAQHGLNKSTTRPRKVADWDKWHLLLNGKSYPSKFKDETEWLKFYHPGIEI